MRIAKAVVAAVLAAAGAVNTVLASGNGFTVADGVAVVLAVLAAIGVYRVPNKAE